MKWRGLEAWPVVKEETPNDGELAPKSEMACLSVYLCPIVCTTSSFQKVAAHPSFILPLRLQKFHKWPQLSSPLRQKVCAPGLSIHASHLTPFSHLSQIPLRSQ